MVSNAAPTHHAGSPHELTACPRLLGRCLRTRRISAKIGRASVVTLDILSGVLRSVRVARVLQRGEDFLRAAYEWPPAAA
jgi:hypothetical protein